MYFPDLATETQIDRGLRVRAIGWLSRDHKFPTGNVPGDFSSRLRTLCDRWSDAVTALYWPVAGGWHDCEFCDVARAGGNLGVPAGQVLFVAPELVAHYVEIHRYRPPDAFIAAVLECPLPGSNEYAQSVAAFREINLASARARRLL